MNSESERNCYCDLWKTNPSVLEKQGIPRGFCGLCKKCRKPGHTRQHPGVISYTGSWCDHHYKILARTHPATPVGFVLWLGGIATLVYLVKDLF